MSEHINAIYRANGRSDVIDMNKNMRKDYKNEFSQKEIFRALALKII